MLSRDEEIAVEKQFDSFCGVVLRHKCGKYIKKASQTTMNDVAMDANDSYCSDKYFSKWCFTILKHKIRFRNEPLGEGLSVLDKRDRDILLLDFFVDMKDDDIAAELHITPRTVNRQRKNAIKLVKAYMEEHGYDD